MTALSWLSPGSPAGFLLAAGAFVLVIEGCRRLAVRQGIVSHPNPIVRSHRAPVAYLGGTGLGVAYAGLLALHWLATGGTTGGAPGRAALARAAAALAFTALGTWDDLRPLRPRAKFLAQAILAGAFLVAAGGSSSPLALAGELLVLLTLINAYNLVDVLDGLLTLLAAVALIGFLLLPGAAPGGTAPELALMLAGLAAIFLFNRPPARIYLGDAGSLTLGFLIGAWLIEGSRGRAPGEAAALGGLCAVPLLELALLIPARLRRGLSPFTGSPDHFALRLQDQLGWSRWRVLGAAGGASVFFALAPLVLEHARPLAPAHGLAAALAAGVLWWGCWRIPPRPAGAARKIEPWSSGSRTSSPT